MPQQHAERAAFLRESRCARLARDQLFDLHARLFLCFSRQGFDDEKWFADEDLRLLIQRGKAQIMEIEAIIADKEAQLTLAEAEQDSQGREARLRSLKSDIGKQKEKIGAIKSSLSPLADEAESRRLFSARLRDAEQKNDTSG